MAGTEDSHHIPNLCRNTCIPYILVIVWTEYQYLGLVWCDAVSLVGGGGV